MTYKALKSVYYVRVFVGFQNTTYKTLKTIYDVIGPDICLQAPPEPSAFPSVTPNRTH